MEEQDKFSIIVEDLCGYCLERDDIKWVAAGVPEDSGIEQNKLEYELQILKIVTVGWSISFFLEREPVKTPLLEAYWQNVNELANNLSQATAMMTSADVDYFQVIRSRLDDYVQAAARGKQNDPASAIGSEFAGHCGDKDSIFASLAGGKLFMSVCRGVKEYMQAAGFDVRGVQPGDQEEKV